MSKSDDGQEFSVGTRARAYLDSKKPKPRDVSKDGTLEALPATLFVKYDPNDPTEQPAPISTDALERYAIQTMDAIADAIREARTAPPGYIIDDKGVVRKTTTSVVYQNRGRDSVEVEAGEMLLILAPVSTREAAEEGRK